MNEHVKKHSVQWGLIVGGISVIYAAIAYAIDWSLFANAWAGIIMGIIGISLLLIPVARVKKAQGGYLSFKEGFSAYVLGWIIQAFIGVAFNLLLFNAIDPESGAEINEMIMDTQIERLESFGMSDEQMAASLERLEEMDSFSVETQLQGILYSIIFGAVIGLIVGAAFSKKRPILDDEQQEETLDA
ncbi:MAG: DUF4199 domain-containing protein [Flavobacteriia bacterium]|nr:DUF4199 domain-containing protein [Flavobacteriia bacterium]